MTRRIGRRQKIKKGSEFDILGSFKRLYCYLKRAGVKKAIKRGMNRRVRQEEYVRREDAEREYLEMEGYGFYDER